MLGLLILFKARRICSSSREFVLEIVAFIVLTTKANRTDLIRLFFPPPPINKEDAGLKRNFLEQLNDQSADCLRFMFFGSASQSIRPFKSIGPSTRISQFSPARDPEMETRQSPRLSLNACSMLAVISFDSRASPRFSSSAVTPIAV